MECQASDGPGDRYAEHALRDLPRAQVGVFLRGKSVRLVSEKDFFDITAIGMDGSLQLAGNYDGPKSEGGEKEIPILLGERQWRVQKILTNRVIRDAYFRNKVCISYDHTCAFTKLRIEDGNGNSEAQAAHIWPVTEGGPDIVQNGIALSATIYWLFDRHLISIADDYSILVAPERLPKALISLFENNRLECPP